MRRPAWVTAIFIGMLALISNAMAAGNPQAEGLSEQIVETKPRDSVYQRSLLSRKAKQGEKWLVVSFPGHPGVLRLAETDGMIDYELKGNFLVRSRRHLVSEDIAVATLDCPSDEFSACGDAYRSSDRHVRDVEAQIVALKNVVGSNVRVALVGTSYGTVSSEILALKLSNKVDAAIHTASITMPTLGNGIALNGIDLSKLKMRQLLVHHQDDPCRLTPFAPLKKYEGVIPIMLVRGIANSRGPACEAFTAHGFVGREQAVMNRIGDWLLTDRLTPIID